MAYIKEVCEDCTKAFYKYIKVPGKKRCGTCRKVWLSSEEFYSIRKSREEKGCTYEKTLDNIKRERDGN